MEFIMTANGKVTATLLILPLYLNFYLKRNNLLKNLLNNHDFILCLLKSKKEIYIYTRFNLKFIPKGTIFERELIYKFPLRGIEEREAVSIGDKLPFPGYHRKSRKHFIRDGSVCREFTSRRTREAVSRHGATWHKSQWDASLIILAGTLCNCDGRVHAYLPEQILRQLEICVYRLSFFSFLFFFFASPSDFRWTGNTYTAGYGRDACPRLKCYTESCVPFHLHQLHGTMTTCTFVPEVSKFKAFRRQSLMDEIWKRNKRFRVNTR